MSDAKWSRARENPSCDYRRLLSHQLLRAPLSFQSLIINTLKMVNLIQTSHHALRFSISLLTHGSQKTLDSVNNHFMTNSKACHMNTRNNLKSIPLGFSVWLSFRTRAGSCFYSNNLVQKRIIVCHEVKDVRGWRRCTRLKQSSDPKHSGLYKCHGLSVDRRTDGKHYKGETCPQNMSRSHFSPLLK